MSLAAMSFMLLLLGWFCFMVSFLKPDILAQGVLTMVVSVVVFEIVNSEGG